MNKKRLLVIDDDEVDRKSICRILKKIGWEGDITQAVSANEARCAVAVQKFDCIVLDYSLPGVNGLDLLTELHVEVAIGTPVVILTGEGNEMVAVEAMKRGAYDYLPKALLEPSVLIRVLTQALEKSHLQRELATAQTLIEHQALHDSLTNLGNRRLLMRDLDRAIASTMRSKIPFCLLMMDLNKFKAINDNHGHDVGDVVLAEISRRLVAAGRSNDTFYRLGGDEFTAILDTVGKEAVPPIVQRIQDSVAIPILWDGEPLIVGISIGIASYVGDASSGHELLRSADSAMYDAKRTAYRTVASAKSA